MIQLSQVTRPGKTALLPSPGWAQGGDRTGVLFTGQGHLLAGTSKDPHWAMGFSASFYPQVSLNTQSYSRSFVIPEVEDTAFQ